MNSTPLIVNAPPLLSNNFVRWLGLGFCAAILSGCATGFKMNVVASATPNTATSYALKNANKKESESSAHSQKATELVKKALATRGFREADAKTPADMIIDVDFGVEARQQRQAYTAISSQVERTSASSGGLQANRGAEGGLVFNPEVGPPEDPQAVAVRTNQVSKEMLTTVYGDYFTLTARDNPAKQGAKTTIPLWTVSVRSDPKTDKSDHDIGDRLPTLVAAAIDFIGKDSQGSKQVTLSSDAAEAAFTKKAL